VYILGVTTEDGYFFMLLIISMTRPTSINKKLPKAIIKFNASDTLKNISLSVVVRSAQYNS
ncbi:hypothetical protein, partial [Lactococcus fujiensis]|uniref:hypothetical protein n=1 Tax=Lactococcus fujiensis TaxID=610251 RepID=UPI001FE7ECF9